MIGTCIWFNPDTGWGYAGHGIFSNNAFEFQVYCHYKNMKRDGQRNPKFRELKPNDVIEFDVGAGYLDKGTQAINIRIVQFAEDECKDK